MAKKDSIKQLTPAEIAKQVKALGEQKDFTIKVGGQDYRLTHDATFRQTKKSKLLSDLLSFFQTASNDVSILDLATPYTAMLILKHFTSVEVPDDVLEALATLETLVDLNIINQVLSELPEDELTSVYELVTQTVNNIATNLEDAEQEAIELAKTIGNKEMLDVIPDALKESE